MRKISSTVQIETKYLGVVVSVIHDGELLIVDYPLRQEEGQEWLLQVSELGFPRYLAMMDSHPDRVLGARNAEIPIIGHSSTAEELSQWSDTFKGGAHPIGAEADRVKRVSGIQQAVPELSFQESMKLYIGKLEIEFLHRPGPRPGAMWIWESRTRVLFVGDCVTKSEPPYFGKANLDLWLEHLEELRDKLSEGCKLIASRDGSVGRDEVNQTARFLRKITTRLDKLDEAEDIKAMASKQASQLAKSYRVATIQQELVHKRVLESLLSQLRLRSTESSTA